MSANELIRPLHRYRQDSAIGKTVLTAGDQDEQL